MITRVIDTLLIVAAMLIPGAFVWRGWLMLSSPRDFVTRTFKPISGGKGWPEGRLGQMMDLFWRLGGIICILMGLAFFSGLSMLLVYLWSKDSG